MRFDVCMDSSRQGGWPERRDFRPLCTPINHDIAPTQSARVLSSIMLNDTLDAIEFGISRATIAKEKFLAQRLSMWFDLNVKKPLHIFEC